MSGAAPSWRSEQPRSFVLMLLLAIAVHAIVILGISFRVEPERRSQVPLPTIEVILVHHLSTKPVEKPDYLAQVSEEGGGTRAESRPPKSPLSSPKVLPESQSSQTTQETAVPKPRPKPKPVLAQRREQQPPTPAKESPRPEETKQRPTAAQLMLRSREIAQLSAEIAATKENYAKKPRHKYISARTQAYRYATYMDAWRRKVERIGNLNYPEEAKRSKLSGSLLLDVALKPDGAIESIELRRSSGSKALDDAAVRIVRLAAPFAPFPKDFRKDIDILHIIRTWQFRSDHRVLSR